MKNYHKIYTNNVFHNNLPLIMYEQMDNYALYFLTVTFDNQFNKVTADIYKNYFKAFSQKINQFTVNNPTKNKDLKCRMILVPEHSHDSHESCLTKACHYHGFLMIHNNVNQKFLNKCIMHTYQEPLKTREININERKVTKGFLCSKITMQSKRTQIDCYSHDLQFLNNDREAVFNTCRYATKRLGNWYDKKTALTLSDISAKNSSKTDMLLTDQDKSAYFEYDDVLFFGDISDKKLWTHSAPSRTTKHSYVSKVNFKKLPMSAFHIMMKQKQELFLRKFYAGNY